jgi:hypothetical protein
MILNHLCQGLILANFCERHLVISDKYIWKDTTPVEGSRASVAATTERNRIHSRSNHYERKHSLYEYLFPFQISEGGSGHKAEKHSYNTDFFHREGFILRTFWFTVFLAPVRRIPFFSTSLQRNVVQLIARVKIYGRNLQ